MLQLVPRLQNRRMHLLHRVAELDTEATQDVALPGVVLGVDARLHLLVVDDAHAERLLRLRSVERGTRLLDLRKELLPMSEIFAETIKDVFRLQIPQRLELQPLRDVLLQFLYFVLNQIEGTLESGVREMCQLNMKQVSGVLSLRARVTDQRGVSCVYYSSVLHL